MRKDIIKKVLIALKKAYPSGDKPWSSKIDPFVAVITTALSAQTTDDQVDKISPALFKKYPDSASLSKARIVDVEKIIKSVGLYKTKTKNIIAAAKMLEEKYGGRVPQDRDEMIKLPGVGRKTANVVLIKAFGKNAMPVDTHIFRVSNRIGLADAKTPEKTELELLKIIPEKDLGAAHFWLINHGRKICHARKPECAICPVSKWCRYFKSL